MFNGSWIIDTAASDSPEEMLQAQGIGWAKRKLFLGAQSFLTQIITMDEETMTIEMTSPIKNRTEVHKLDGSIEKKEDDIMGQGEIESSSEWEDGSKQAIIHILVSNISTTRSRRFMLNEDTMVIEVCYKKKDGTAEINLKRVFIRKPSK